LSPGASISNRLKPNAGVANTVKMLDNYAPQEHNLEDWGICVVTDLFTTLEQKLELVLTQIAGLKEANAALRQSVSEKEQALKEAQAELAKVSRERELVRERIDKILNRLKIIDTGESA
jgi:FtsZ-binding cell division protein ZapB